MLEQVYPQVKEKRLKAACRDETAGKLSDPVPRKGDSVKASEPLKEVIKTGAPQSTASHLVAWHWKREHKEYRQCWAFTALGLEE